MQMASSLGEDFLSTNPLLVRILSLLDAKQVLRCMRVNKQFQYSILNNWRRMQRFYMDMDVQYQAYSGINILGERAEIARHVSIVAKLPKKEPWNPWSNRFTINFERKRVAFGCDRYESMTHCLAAKLEKQGYKLKWNRYETIAGSSSESSTENSNSLRSLRSLGTRTQQRLREVASSLMATSRKLKVQREQEQQEHAEQQQTSGSLEPTEHTAKYYRYRCEIPVGDVHEGISVVLNALLQGFDLRKLKLEEKKIPEDLLVSILEGARNTGSRLLEASEFSECTQTLAELLRVLEARDVIIKHRDILNWPFLSLLPSDYCRVELQIHGLYFLSLKPILWLVEEWTQGRREITQLNLVNHEPYSYHCANLDPYPFTLDEFKETFNVFENLALISSSDSNIEVFVGRECDTKMLHIHYNREATLRMTPKKETLGAHLTISGGYQ